MDYNISEFDLKSQTSQSWLNITLIFLEELSDQTGKREGDILFT